MTTIHLDVCTPEGKTWLAEITGLGGQFGFLRSFVNATESNFSRSGMTGTKTYDVSDGVYESSEGRRRYGRRFWKVENGEVTEITADDVRASFTPNG